MNNILEVQGLAKSYERFSLKEVSFSLPRGYIMGFIGPNGAGKSTTIKLILNMIRRQTGSVWLLGSETPAAGDAPLQNEQIGVVLDTPLYPDEWKVRDVEQAVSPFHKQWNHTVFADYLKQFGLDPKKKIKALSRGMKVKLQIAAALSHDAQLLILDEPTSGLDPVARDEICDLLRLFVADENKSVLFSTHITSDLDKTADYITLILQGQILYSGEKDAFLSKYARVSGGLTDLDAEQRKHVIGYREHGTGFEGMAETKHIAKLPGTILIEEISLDEIIIFINKGAAIHD